MDFLLPSALLLLMFGVLADDPDDAVAANHLAFIAYFLDARPDFHAQLLAIISLFGERIYRFLDLICPLRVRPSWWCIFKRALICDIVSRSTPTRISKDVPPKR
jgi:hypothetical protein